MAIFILDKRHKAPGAFSFGWATVAIVLYLGTYAVEMNVPDLEIKLWLYRIQYIGISALPVLLLSAFIQFTGRGSWLTPARVSLISVIPVTGLLAMWTTTYHNLYYHNIRVEYFNDTPLLVFDRGPIYWLYTANYLCMILAMVLVLTTHLRSTSPSGRSQITWMIIGTAWPLITYPIYLLRIPALAALDLNAFSLIITGVMIAVALWWFGMFDTIPIARDILVENYPEGFLAIDSNGHIIDFNQQAIHLLGLKNVPVSRLPAEEVLGGMPELAAAIYESPNHFEIQLRELDLEITSTPIRDTLKRSVGILLTIHDRTEQKKAQRALRIKDQVFTQLIEQAPLSVAIFNSQKMILYANSSASKLFGVPANQNFSEPLAPKVCPDTKTMDFIWEQVNQRGHLLNYEITLPAKPGETEHRWLISISKIDYFGQPAYLCAQNDITELKQKEVDLQAAKAALETANLELRGNLSQLGQLNQLAHTLSSTLKLEPVLDEILNQAAAVVNAQSCQIYLLPGVISRFMDTQAAWLQPLKQIPAGLTEEDIAWAFGHPLTHRLSTPETTENAGRCDVLAPLFKAELQIGLMVFRPSRQEIFQDSDLLIIESISQQISGMLANILLFNEVETLAQVDSMTGMFTRHHFATLAAHEVNYSLRYNRPLSLISMDIDHFKNVNDRYGHPTGDLVLTRLGEVVRQQIRAVDVAGRYGGEEFLILLPSISIDEACLVADRLRKAIEVLEIPHPLAKIKITLSLGVVQFNPQTDRDFDTLIQRADLALYAAKNTGRNRVVCRE